jgi:hypothetical protein
VRGAWKLRSLTTTTAERRVAARCSFERGQGSCLIIQLSFLPWSGTGRAVGAMRAIASARRRPVRVLLAAVLIPIPHHLGLGTRSEGFAVSGCLPGKLHKQFPVNIGVHVPHLL